MKYNNVATRRLGSSAEGVCALVQDMLPFYLEDDLSAQSRMFIDGHLETCDRCASFLAGGRSVQEHLRRDASLRDNIIQRDTKAQDVVTRGRRQLMGWTLIGAGIAALVVLGVVFGFGPRGPRMNATSEATPIELLAPEADTFVEIATPTPWSALPAFGGDVSAPVPDAVLPTVVPPAIEPVVPTPPPALP